MKTLRNPEKRKRVMQRSMRLGHCVCDPRQSCPCDLLREQDICHCAGERADAPAGEVALTKLVEKPGCASKIDKTSLDRILSALPTVDDPNVLVGVPAGDDAGVYALDGDLALVQTVDVFSPSVDDPYTFGRIAAANSVSDIYAMGARPITALSIVGFPIRDMPEQAMRDILRGGIDQLAEAGVAVVGGHSINDQSVKAGFAVTGLVDRHRIITNAGAARGDALILTKPLGTGVTTFAAQIGRASSSAVKAIAASMSRLNREASQLMIAFGAHACTDVTGFGLAGHLAALAEASGVDVQIAWDDLPLFEGVLECLAGGVIPGAVERNRESCQERVVAGEGVTREMMDVLFDAQTSGGLLIALPDEDARQMIEKLHEAGDADAAIIGAVVRQGRGAVHVRTTGARRLPEVETNAEPATVPATSQGDRMMAHANEDSECCSDAGPPAARTDLEGQFKAFMKSACAAPGALDITTKQTVNVALATLSRCEPCLKAHIKKARGMGFTQEEIDEAAWMAVSFGGGPVMMFYKSVIAEVGE